MVFGLLDDLADIGKKVVKGTTNTIDRGVEGLNRTTGEVLGNTAEQISRGLTRPVTNTTEIIDGLTEGELRERAIIELGSDVVDGMILSELIEWYRQEESL